MAEKDKIVHGVLAKVSIGDLVVDGICFADSVVFDGEKIPEKYGVAIPQIFELFGGDQGLKLSRPKDATRTLKRLMGESFKSRHFRVKELNTKNVNVVSLNCFQQIVTALDRQGNKKAQFFRDLLFGLSLRQLFADAFGEKFEKEERQQWLMLRQETKDTFRPLTDQLKAQGFNEPHEYARFVHAFQSKLGIEDGTRDEQINAKLAQLITMQTKVATLMECGMPPYVALEKGFANYRAKL